MLEVSLGQRKRDDADAKRQMRRAGDVRLVGKWVAEMVGEEASLSMSAADIDIDALLELSAHELDALCGGGVQAARGSNGAAGRHDGESRMAGGGTGRKASWQKRLRWRALEELARRAGLTVGGDGREGGGMCESVMTCLVCLEEVRSRLLQPCGHMCVCACCVLGLTACPVCGCAVNSSLSAVL